MRVLFVFPDLSPNVNNYTGAPSFGIAMLAAVLRQAGHEASLYHMLAEPTEEEFRDRVRAAAPDLVAFSAISHYARRLPRWAALAHAAAGAPVVVGGIHATLATEAVAAIPEVRFTCVGEGEGPLVELCAALAAGDDPSRIPSLWARENGQVRRNAPRPRVQDLGSLPDPDFSIFDFDRLHLVRRGYFSYIMSRGCAYHCTYCSSHALGQATPGAGPYWRFLEPRQAVAQLERLLAAYMPGAERVQFLDAILFPGRKWLAEFAPLYRRRIGLPFACSLRANFVDDECAALLRDAGCSVVRLGVESGDDRIANDVLRRGLTAERLRRAFAVLARHGIGRWSYNMVGLPGENLRLALRTVRLNGEVRPESMIPFIFYPYPGTELHRLCAERGYLTGREYDHYKIGVVTRLPGFPAHDILFAHRFFGALARLYGVGRSWPPRARDAWAGLLDVVLTSPVFPRRAILALEETYRALRHRLGVLLVRRSPRLYRALGGSDPL